MPSEFEINDIFSEMEMDLIAGYQRTMARNSPVQATGQIDWAHWRMRKLIDLRAYQTEAKRIVSKANREAKSTVKTQLADSFLTGSTEAEDFLSSQGFKKPDVDSSFGVLNRRKMDALIDAVDNDLDKASVAALRLVDDQYRQIIFKSQAMFNAGAGTLGQAIDMAAKDFLSAGINSITYANGAKYNIASYAEMALRTSSKRAYLTGKGAKAAEYEIYTVKVSSYGMSSDTCLPWQGRVYIDDVYNNGKATGEYMLLSTAIEAGLYHPNCRHTHGIYFEGISNEDSKPTEGEIQEIRRKNKAETRQRQIERNIKKYKRLEEGAVDNGMRKRSQEKVKAWQKEMRSHLKQNTFLRRSYRNEKIYGIQ